MTAPDSNMYLPHLLAVTLDSNGVAYSNVLATNRSTGKTLIKATNVNKKVVFDISQFSTGYTNGCVIELQNVGTSSGGTTVTVDTSAYGIQYTTITCAAASTAVLSM